MSFATVVGKYSILWVLNRIFSAMSIVVLSIDRNNDHTLSCFKVLPLSLSGQIQKMTKPENCCIDDNSGAYNF